MIMKKLSYNTGSCIIDLNDVVENVSSLLGVPAHIESFYGYHSVYINGHSRYTSKNKEAIYAYISGILNFATHKQ